MDWLDGIWGRAGDVAGRAVEQGYVGIMLSIWSAGLWVLRLVLGVMDRFLTPDLTAEGPAAEVYRSTFWIAATLVVVMALVQLGVAAFRRDGKSLARVVIGVGQFVAVWAAWLAYGALLVTACGGLTRALMGSLLKINDWSQWEPLPGGSAGKGVTEAFLATVLGVLGIFLFVAAIGHFFVMLTRAAALLVLAAVTPIAAAGLALEAGRSWFWKSLRWFHAAAFTPVLTVLVMGIGTKLTAGVAQGGTRSAEAAVGTAFAGVMLIVICLVAPVALFRLLAFADPGTSSGAAMRSGMSGIQGLLSGLAGPSGGSSSSAASTSQDGQSQGEAQRNQQTASRVASVASAAGPVGAGVAAGVGVVAALGAKAATVGIDTMNQTGVGDSSYFPDYERGRGRQNNQQGAREDQESGRGSDGDPQGEPRGAQEARQPSGPDAQGGDAGNDPGHNGPSHGGGTGGQTAGAGGSGGPPSGGPAGGAGTGAGGAGAGGAGAGGAAGSAAVVA